MQRKTGKAKGARCLAERRDRVEQHSELIQIFKIREQELKNFPFHRKDD